MKNKLPAQHNPQAPITAIIVDDEASSRRVFRNLLTAYHPTINILDSYPDLPSAVQGIKIHQPQVVFLDVQMPNFAGYEIAHFFDTIDFHIVFVTAYDQYAIKAFELSAVDYLLKPVNRQRLSETIKKLEKVITLTDNYTAYHQLLQHLDQQQSQKMVIPEVGNRRVISLSDIIAIEAMGAYTKFYLVNGTSFTTSKNLKYFEGQLATLPQFFRSHRAWIVNLAFVEFRNKSAQVLLLKHGVQAKLARSQMKAFEQQFQRPSS